MLSASNMAKPLDQAASKKRREVCGVYLSRSGSALVLFIKSFLCLDLARKVFSMNRSENNRK